MVAETVCERNDLVWSKCQQEINPQNWSSEKFGNKRFGVALIGLGRMGLIHFRNLMREPRARLLYCVDQDHSRLALCSKSMFFREFGIQALHSDQYETVLKDPQVLAVLIATPTGLHEEQVKMALMAGKNVMCEKPLTPNTDSIMKLHHLALENHVYLLTAFNRRYDPDYRQMRRRLTSNAIGSLQIIRVTARDCQPPPLSYVLVSGGIFHDTCIHDIDLCLWMARQLPSSIQVMGKTWKEFYLNDPEQYAKLSVEDRELLSGVDDYFMVIITMKFQNGSLAVIDNSRQASYGYDQRCEVLGSNGMLKCDGRNSNNLIECNDLAAKHPMQTFGFASRFQQAYANEVDDILTMIELAQMAKSATSAEDQVEVERLSRERLLEPVRASLVMAAHTIADACVEAAATGTSIEMKWNKWLEDLFEKELELIKSEH